nr:glycosyltransferase family 8 protein [uncultured Acetatifactor sp.]
MDICINVVYITDEAYAMFTCVSITSLISNMDKGEKVRIFILYGKLSNLTKERFSLLRNDRVIIELIEVQDEKYLKLAQKSVCRDNTYVTGIALLKFSLPDILQHEDKAIYLDGDVLVQNSIRPLYDYELGDCYVAAVNDMLDADMDGHSMLAERIGLKCKDYFNSGVMVLNLKKMRTDAVVEELLKYRENGVNYFMDQDALNAVLGERRIKLPYIYNFMSTVTDAHDADMISEKFFDRAKKGIEECIDAAVILHLTGARKPWKYRMPWYSGIFLKYYAKSPYSKEELHLKSPIKELLDEFYEMRNSYESKIDYLTRISEEKDYMAPYDRIEKGCRLVLYGAGKVGKSYYKQLLSAQYCNIVLVVDKRGADAGEGIRNVNEISQTDYDYILVAIKKRSLALAAIDFLKKEFSVDDDRIINVI